MIQIKTEHKQFKIGDKVIIKRRLGGDSILIVNRLTKTQAICDVFNKDGKKRYSQKFRIDYTKDENGYCCVWPVPAIEWDTNIYKVVSIE